MSRAQPPLATSVFAAPPFATTVGAAASFAPPERRFADASRCPDCAAPVPAGATRCPSCGLPLAGPAAAELWRLLNAADASLDLLRAQRVPSWAAPPPPGLVAGPRSPGLVAGPRSPGLVAAPPPWPGRRAPTARRVLPAWSVPVLLLAVGALCLVVAAVVFVAVTWGALSVGARTAILAGVTALAGAVVAWAARRGLTATAEALATVTAGLLAVDLAGAWGADLAGVRSVGPAAWSAIAALVVAVSAAAAAWLIQRTPIGRLVSAEATAAGALLVATWSAADLWAAEPAWYLALACLALATAAAGLHRLRLGVAAPAVAVLAAVAYAILALCSLSLAVGAADGLWASPDGLPLLVTGAIGLVGARVPLPASWPGVAGGAPGRRGAGVVVGWCALTAWVWLPLAADGLAPAVLGAALLAVGLLELAAVLGPALRGPTRAAAAPWGALTVVALGAAALVAASVVGAAVANAWTWPARVAVRAVGDVPSALQPGWVLGAGVLLTVAVGLAAPRRRGLAAVAAVILLVAAVSALLVSELSLKVVLAALLALAAVLLVVVAAAAWLEAGGTTAPPGRLPATAAGVSAAAAPGVSAAGVPAAGVSAPGVSAAGVPAAGVSAAGVPAAGVSAAGVSVAGVSAAGVSVAGVSVAGAAVSAAAVSAAAVSAVRRAGPVATASVLGCAVLLAAASRDLSAVAWPAAALLAAAAVLVVPAGVARAAAAGLAVGLAAAVPAPFLDRAGAPGGSIAVAVGGVAAGVVVLAGVAAGRVARDVRAGLEVGALLTAAAAAAVWVAVAGGLGWLAVLLTVLGAGTCAAALLATDRRVLAVPGVALLLAASWVRLADLGVTTVEAYTLPTALVLLGVGAWRLRADPDLRSPLALGPGLLLALLPSLPSAWAEPASTRGALLAAAAAGCVALGMVARLAAPFVAGLGLVAVLAVRWLAPVVAPLPGWVLPALAGCLLVWVGITWDHRRHQVHVAARYVGSLR